MGDGVWRNVQSVLAWIIFSLVLIVAYPWAAWLLAQNGRDDGPLLTLALTPALSIGALTLLMFWQSLLGLRFTAAGITLPYLAVMLPGWALWRREERSPFAELRQLRLPQSRLLRAALLIALGVSGAILFNAVYWPFSRDDALGIYHFFGSAMRDSRGVVPLIGEESLYRTYPILIPLTYTYSYLLSGWPNEYLARVAPALLSIGTLPATYVLGRSLYGRNVGWLAALLLALTPTFGRWASAGYVDLPMAFFYTLAAVFAWRLWQSRHWTDALLAGTLMGLAAWTKNAALLGILFLGVWVAWAWLKRHIDLPTAMLTMSASAAVAAPWYLRNLDGAGFIIPETAWTPQAQRTIDNLLIFVTRDEIYGFVGPLMLLGVGASLVYLAYRRQQAPEHMLLLLWTLPFFGAWWWFVSYDPRFLLLFLPLLTIIAAVWVQRVWEEIPALWRARLSVPIIVVALLLAGQVAWNSVEFKDDILRDPFMDNAAKHALVLGE